MNIPYLVPSHVGLHIKQMIFNYVAYGLTIQTDQAIPGLRTLAQTPSSVDISVFLNTSDEISSLDILGWNPHSRFRSRRDCDQGEKPILRILESSDGRYTRLMYIDGINFTLNQIGTRVWVTWPAIMSHEQVWQYLLNPILGFCLRLREVVCLHASAFVVDDRAVLIAGPSGSGKSTVTSFFALRGNPILADDVSVLEEINHEIYARPGYPVMRLWPESVAALLGDEITLPKLAPYGHKRYLDLQKDEFQFVEQMIPVDVVYIIQDRGAEMSINPLSPAQALMNLMKNTYLDYLIDNRLRAADMNLLAKLVNTVAIRKVIPEDSLNRLPSLYEAILNDLRDLKKIANYSIDS